MLRTALLFVIVIVSLSSGSILKKSLSRRQVDSTYCHAIEGFDCKCSYQRVTCTNDRELPSKINVLPDEKNKYYSVELVITAPTNVNVNDQTFEPVKQLYKLDGYNYDFRIKFEKFTGLQLSSPGVFNNVFPDNLPSNARKNLALEIYNPDAPPQNNPSLFKNLNADALELYGLHPLQGSFQQLFDGANIKFLRLSGGDLKSDVNQPFTGNIAKVEIAKQATELSVQNFPVYPAHELVINAYYVSEFDSQYPPNYSNLNELRIFSLQNIPANAFKNFPNLKVLELSSAENIDPQALNGLNNLQKLILKDAKVPLDLLNSLPNVKELEANIGKLDEKTQCQLVEKLANGQLAVQSIPNGRDCTCVLAYLDSASGRQPCQPQHCEHSSCAAIKNNYDASTNTFTNPPAITRADGSNALFPQEPKSYSSSYQIPYQDQEKLQKGIPQYQPPQPTDQGGQGPSAGGDQDGYPSQPPYNPQGQQDGQDQDGTGDGNDSGSPNQTGDNQDGSQGTGNQGEGDGSQAGGAEGGVSGEGAGNSTETATTTKKGMSWIPIIIIAAAIVGLLLIGLIILLIRKKRAKGGYNQAPTGEPGAATTTSRQ